MENNPVLLVDKALEGRKEPDLRREQRGLPRKRNITPGTEISSRPPMLIFALSPAERPCPNCGSPLRMDTAVEIGHIF